MIEEISVLGLGKYKIEERGRKGIISMNLQEMETEQLKAIQERISQEVKFREDKEINELTDEFLKVWKKMENAGFRIDTAEIGDWDNNGERMKEVVLEMNGKLIKITQ